MDEGLGRVEGGEGHLEVFFLHKLLFNISERSSLEAPWGNEQRRKKKSCSG